MARRTLSVGAGAGNDVVLARYGHCDFVSPRHAAIFFDEATQHFELLNYSEHGTTVDNVLFSCDFSDKKQQHPAAAEEEEEAGEEEEAEVAARAEVDRRRRRRQLGARAVSPLPTPAHVNPSKAVEPAAAAAAGRCGCRRGVATAAPGDGGGAGWEGTALLAHGSLLRFGCLHFVFSLPHASSSIK